MDTNNWDWVIEEVNEDALRERAKRVPPRYTRCLPGTPLQQFLKKTEKDTNFFQFFRYFLKFLDYNCSHAVFLQDLINREFMMHEKCRRIVLHAPGKTGMPDKARMRRCEKFIDLTGFFRCSRGFLLKDSYVPWSVEQQKDYFNALKERGLIDVDRRTNQRWVRINYGIVLSKREQFY